MAFSLAESIVEHILDNLESRRGLREIFGEIEEDTYEELKYELVNVVERQFEDYGIN